MLAFTVHVENIVIDYKTLLTEYEPSKINRLIKALSEKYKIFMIGEYIDTNHLSYSSIQTVDEAFISPTSTVILTNDLNKIPEYHLKNISTILLTENVKDSFTIDDIYRLPDLILTLGRARAFLLDQLDFGYRNEIAVEKYLSKTGNGVLNKPKGLLYVVGEVEHQLHKDIKAELIVSGRFFTTGDTRAYTDVLTLYLLRYKEERSFAVQVFAESLKVCLHLLKPNQKYDVITTVPARTKRNRLNAIFETAILEEYQDDFYPNLLKVQTMYKAQKQAGGRFSRAKNVEDKFIFTHRIHGDVLLIDDIFTTGATTLECARMLYQAGAKSVTILPFAVTQHKVTTTIRNPVRDVESQDYILKLNNENGEPYWQSSVGNHKDYHKIRDCYYAQ